MSDTAPTSPAVDCLAVLLVHQGGRITHANQAALAFWHAEPGSLSGEYFASLFATNVATDDGAPKPDLWLHLLGSSLDREITLQLQPGNVSSPENGDSLPEVHVRVEKLSDVIYLATVQPVVKRNVTPASAVVDPPPPQPVLRNVETVPSSPLASTDSGLSALLQHGAVGFFDLDVRTGRASYSPTWKRMLGYGEDSMPNTIEAWRGLIHPDDSAAAPDQLGKRISANQRPFNVEFRMRHQDGRWVWIQSVGVQFLSSSGDVERVIGLNLDISERKQVEEDSLVNDERLELLSAGSLGVFDLDFSHNNYWFSPGWGALLGYRENEIHHELDTFLRSLGSEGHAVGVEQWIRSRSGDRTTFVTRELLIGKDGKSVPVHLGVHQVLTRRHELSRVVGSVSPASSGNMTSGSPAPLVEQALAALAEGVIVTDATGKVVSINPAACRLLRTKSDDVLGVPAADVFRLVQRVTGLPGDDPITRALSEIDPLPQLTDSALPAESAIDLPRPIIWTARSCRDAAGLPEGVVILFRDPAEIALTPDELLKANRLESLGIVAGGIAHDFNDLLTTILGGISLAKEQTPSGMLEESEKACLSAKGLTKQLLTFAKGGSVAHSVMSAEEILNAAIKLAAAGSDAAINVEIAEGTQPVRVDRLQMAQVFQNLIINALQAMPGPPHRPQVQLRVANTSVSADQIPPLPEGDYVEFEVRDNAIGISPENLEKIFDPFFTTRKHGTGLGLAAALSIVRKHGGQIGVGSTPGEGTVFTVFLPRADAPSPPPTQTAPSLRFRTGRILFMDDDPRITALTATMLESLEYKYDVARDGSEAIQLYQRYFNVGRPYDAVILDLTVAGGMGGEECFKLLRDCDPDVRAIICTGYDNDGTARNFIDQGFCGYLTKPYRIADLGKVLKAILG